MKNLGEWVAEHEMEQADLARSLDCSTSTVCRLVNGKQIPRPALMKKIQEVTGGEVPPGSFFSDEPPAPMTRASRSRAARKGALARAASLTPERRKEIAQTAATTRWDRVAAKAAE